MIGNIVGGALGAGLGGGFGGHGYGGMYQNEYSNPLGKGHVVNGWPNTGHNPFSAPGGGFGGLGGGFGGGYGLGGFGLGGGWGGVGSEHHYHVKGPQKYVKGPTNADVRELAKELVKTDDGKLNLMILA